MGDGLSVEYLLKAIETLDSMDVPDNSMLALRRHQLPMFGLSDLSDDELKGRGIFILEDEDILYG